MKKSLEKRTLESTLASGLGIALSLVQSVLLVPLFLKYWGTEKFGAWISIYAFLLLLRTLELGYQNYVGNEFNKAYHLDKNRAQYILGSSVRFSLVVACLEIMVYGLIAWGPFELSVIGVEAHQLTGIDYRYGLFLFVGVWSFWGNIGGLLVRVILAEGHFAKSAYFGVVYKLLEISILLCGVYAGWSIFTVCVAYALATTFYYAYYFYFIYRLMHPLYPWWKTGNGLFGARLYVRSLLFTMNGFIDQFANSGLLLMVSKVIGLAFVPLLNTIRSLTNFVLQLTNLVSNPLSPELIRYNTLGESQKLQYVFETHWFLAGLLVHLPFLVSTFFIGDFFNWWVGGRLTFDPELFFWLSYSVALINFSRMFTVYLSGINANLPLFFIGILRIFILVFILLTQLADFNLNLLGLSIVIAESVCSLLIPSILIFRTLFPKHNRVFLKHWTCTVLQILLLGLGFYSALHWPAYGTIWMIACIGGILLLMTIQWRNLDAEVRQRLWALLFGSKILPASS